MLIEMVKKFQGNNKSKENVKIKKEGLEQQINEEIKDDKKIDEKKEDIVTEKKETEEVVSDTTKNMDEKLAEWQDKYLRLSAEFDNYRKRTLKEKMELIKTASEDVVLKIIPVLDDFERAIDYITNNDSNDAANNGVVLIYNKLKDILIQQGLKEIVALNSEFNTDIHEAVTKIPAPEEDMKGKIVDVIQKGYFLYDKVIRHAKVVVGE